MSPSVEQYLLSFFPAARRASSSHVFDSPVAEADADAGALSTDPADPFWQPAPAVWAERSNDGSPAPGYRVEARSRWTHENLYFLFVCPYKELSLNPSPRTDSETNRLWDWDVAEVFIGSDFENTHRYKEFEISPQGEWVDLDIDLSKPHHEDGWSWASGLTVSARIDSTVRTWFGAMCIPFAAISPRLPVRGETFRVNFFWSRRYGSSLAWRPTESATFHVPERFGLLRLVGEPG